MCTNYRGQQSTRGEEGGNGAPRRTLKTDSLIAQVVVRAVWELLCRKEPEGLLRIVMCAQAHTLSYSVVCSVIQTNKTVVHRPACTIRVQCLDKEG